MNRIGRREFLGSVLIAAGGCFAHPALASSNPSRRLIVDTRSIDVAGRAATVFRIDDSDQAAPFRFKLNEPFRVTVDNHLAEPTLLHWHGLTPPWRQDGVPYFPHPPIEPGDSHPFSFVLDHPGTFWMHSHFDLQLQAMLAAPLIVVDPEESVDADVDIVVMLQDFSFRPAEEILGGLVTGEPEMHGDMTSMSHGMGTSDMSGMPMHANDFDHDAYLINDRTLDDPEVVTIGRGDRVRLRIVNAAAATGFHIDTGALVATVVAVDGTNVVPVTGRRFPLSPGQRIDLVVSIPTEGGSFPLLALREGARERTGLVLATTGATIPSIAPVADAAAPLLDLGFERSLAAAVPDATRSADRRLDVALTGSHRAYSWGITIAESAMEGSTAIEYGEQVEMAIRNPTPMAHPMHLHGHQFQVVGIGSERFSGALRDTVLVPPNHTVTIAFEANNPGRWAFHCHHLYHMAAGMMTTIDYRGAV